MRRPQPPDRGPEASCETRSIVHRCRTCEWPDVVGGVSKPARKRSSPPSSIVGFSATRHRTRSSSPALIGGCAEQPARPADPRDGAGIVHFSGSIDPAAVDAFIARHATDRVDRVVVDSPGGDVVAGIRFANRIADRRADVEVENLCASSCANDLFAAGRRKIIDDRAPVLWHGSILQKDFRERGADCDRRILKAAGAPGYDAQWTRRSLEAEVEYCRSYRQAVELQRAFFARVGVDEYITRMGQEPQTFDGIWTVPVAVMQRMGLTGVEARPEYGSHEDLKHWNHDATPRRSCRSASTTTGRSSSSR